MSWTAYDGNGDGWADMHGYDADYDGDAEFVQLDRNQDGYVDGLMADNNNDGSFEIIAVDGNQNGYFEGISADTNYDGYLDTGFADNNENGVDDSQESYPTIIFNDYVGGQATYDGAFGNQVEIARLAGRATFGTADSDGDGYLDNNDSRPDDPRYWR